MNNSIKEFISKVEKMNPNEPEFLQAVKEVAEAIIPFIEENKYKNKIIRKNGRTRKSTNVQSTLVGLMTAENTQVNRGYRVEFNSAIGPYKGGLRFHPTVNLSYS